MCSGNCLKFVEDNLAPSEITGKKILEIGSYFVNGSIRWAIEQHNPESYLGIDMSAGPCVDEVCTIEDTFDRFEPESFDIVVSAELLEHVLDFRVAINAMKRLCKQGGIILLTTRSKGFPIHGYPYDFWRYEIEDMCELFADYKISNCIPDPSIKSPGVFLKAVKIDSDSTLNITDQALYNILLDRRTTCNTEELSKIVDSGRFKEKQAQKSYFTNFTELYACGARRNTDKTTHGYLPKYDLFLQQFKQEQFTLLELGVHKASSLMMWRDYFPHADIVGVDKNANCAKFSRARMTIKTLDLDDINTYAELVKLDPKVIVDDASHFWDHQILSFFQLFGCLKQGGVYILEDIQTSFEPLKEKYHHNISVSPFELLQTISEAVASRNSSGRVQGHYHVLLAAC